MLCVLQLYKFSVLKISETEDGQWGAGLTAFCITVYIPVDTQKKPEFRNNILFT